MTENLFEWDAKVRRSVVIEADNEEEAHQKWVDGDYDSVETDDEDVLNKYVELDGEVYKYDRFEKYY